MSEPQASFERRVLMLLVAALLIVGAVSRIAPLFDQGERIFQQFPTEDGYLMLQIAHNIGIGKGMSIADGTIATNGTQPLTTLIWSAVFAAVDGAKKPGVAIILVVQMLFSAAAAFAIFRLGARLMRDWQYGTAAAALAAAVWYGSHLTARHTQNCLETGVYSFFVVTSVLLYLRAYDQRPDAPQPWLWCAGFGAWLGLAFLSRNDACFLILGVCVVHWLSGPRAMFVRRLQETIAIGAVSVAVASPWLIYNYVNFGHLMPISGVAESLHAEFAENLIQWPAPMAEYVLLIFGIPTAFETEWWAIVVFLGVVACGIGAYAVVFAKSEKRVRAIMAIGGLYALGLGFFYALFFGVGFFMNRYLFPLSTLTAILWAVVLISIWKRIPQQQMRHFATMAVAVAVLALVAGQNVRSYLKGAKHLHWQVVQWVGENVSDETWVGAIQTGTLGFFHDRTINLDGKTNPHALERRKLGEIPGYVVESEIMYLADWAGNPETGIVSWLRLYPQLGAEFEVIVEDYKKNLAVLGRKSRPDHFVE
jgi:hypothetical protein